MGDVYHAQMEHIQNLISQDVDVLIVIEPGMLQQINVNVPALHHIIIKKVYLPLAVINAQKKHQITITKDVTNAHKDNIIILEDVTDAHHIDHIIILEYVTNAL